MKDNRLKGTVITGLSIFISGCGEVIEAVKPDRVSVGAAVREIRGGYKDFKVETVAPLWDIRAKKKLNDNLDVCARTQFNQGTLDARHVLFKGNVGGDFESVGIGLNYFPFDTRLVGLDAGAEVFRAGYKMKGRFGPIRQTTPDRFWGGGFNLGTTGEIPLNTKKKWQIIWGAGYNFTEINAKKANVDLDGWYGFIGIQINLKGKEINY